MNCRIAGRRIDHNRTIRRGKVNIIIVRRSLFTGPYIGQCDEELAAGAEPLSVWLQFHGCPCSLERARTEAGPRSRGPNPLYRPLAVPQRGFDELDRHVQLTWLSAARE